METRFKAVLFDIDGVLVDSEAANMANYKAILEGFGYDVPLPRIKEAMLGNTTHRLFEMLAPESTPEMRDAMVAQVAKNVPYTFLEFRPTAALESVPDISADFLVAAVTNRRQSAYALLNHFGMLGYFSAIHTADSHEPKPSPEMMLAACESLGVSPREAVFFGDNAVDAEAGRLAEIKTHIIGPACGRGEIFRLIGSGRG
ncbi:MAG: HAD family hydrolase [Candidatus Micrarchaeia archaeon]